MNPRVIYVAGPYRAKTLFGVARNIVRAWRVARKLWELGYAPICPHANTLWMSEPPFRVAAHLFLDGDLEILKGCDAILMIKGWEKSIGSLGELAVAKQQKIPVFLSIGDLLNRKPVL